MKEDAGGWAPSDEEDALYPGESSDCSTSSSCGLDEPRSKRPALPRRRVKGSATKSKLKALGAKPAASAPCAERLLHAYRSARIVATACPPIPPPLVAAAKHLERLGRRNVALRQSAPPLRLSPEQPGDRRDDPGRRRAFCLCAAVNSFVG